MFVMAELCTLESGGGNCHCTKFFCIPTGQFLQKNVMSRQPKHKKENSTQFPVKLLVLVGS